MYMNQRQERNEELQTSSHVTKATARFKGFSTKDPVFNKSDFLAEATRVMNKTTYLRQTMKKIPAALHHV